MQLGKQIDDSKRRDDNDRRRRDIKLLVRTAVHDISLKSIPDAIKNICFPLLSSLSLARYPSSNGMINVQRQNRMPLAS